METIRDNLERYWRELACATRSISFDDISRAADILLDCHRRGGTVFVAGNGGSASTASHFACDLSKGTRVENVPHFRVMPLTDNMALMTAWANDTSYDRVFAEQLSALIQPGDVFVVISASGNSPNVLRAAEDARSLGASIVAFTGRGGGKLAPLSDIAVRVPADLIEQVEDAHVIIAHSLCVAIREQLRANADARPMEVWPVESDHVVDLMSAQADV